MKLGFWKRWQSRTALVVTAFLLMALGGYGLTALLRRELPKEGFVMVLEGQPKPAALNVIAMKYAKSATYALCYDYLYDQERLRMVTGGFAAQQRLDLLHGHLDFSEPTGVVLSVAKAMAMFGRTDCLGRWVHVLGKDRKVVGVVQSPRSLEPVVALGRGLKAVMGLPRAALMGPWGLGAGSGSGAGAGSSGGAGHLATPGVQAADLGSINMMGPSGQVDIWIGYDGDLLGARPWVTSLWCKFDDGSDQMHRVANALSLKGLGVRSMAAHGEKTEVYWNFGKLMVLFLAIYYIIRGLVSFSRAVVAEYQYFSVRRYSYKLSEVFRVRS